MLAAATLVGAALRLPFLDHQSLWFDEIYTRDILAQPSLAGLWHQVRATESTPPLYYVLAWLTGAHGAAALRAIPAFALIAAVPASYLTFARILGQRAALATAAIVAVSPALVSSSTNARSYGLLVLTALLSIWAFSALLDRAASRRFALWAAACVACVWTHYFGAFVVGAEIALLLVMRPRTRPATLGWSALVVACLLPLLPLLASQGGDERAGFIAGIPLRTRVSSAARQLVMGSNVPVTWLEAAGLALVGLAGVAGIAMALRSRRGPRVVLVLVAASAGVPLTLALLGVQDRFYARNVIVAAPLAAAVAAPALLRLRALPLAAFLVLASATSLWVATDWRYEQTDWRGALGRAESIDRAAPIVAVTGVSLPVVRTYLRRRPAPPPGVVASRAWIVVEPVRTSGSRALRPAPVPALPGFVAQRTLELHGFTLVLVRAARPTPIASTPIAGASVFAASAPRRPA